MGLGFFVRKNAYSTVKVAKTSDEAALVIGRLRNGGLHPADLALTTPLAAPGSKPGIPVEVPAEEAHLALELLEAKD
jgi:hypothetical protein